MSGRRLSRLGVLAILLVAGCGSRSPLGFVVYRAAPVERGGKLVARMLTVRGTGDALEVVRRGVLEITIRTGKVDPEARLRLRELLAPLASRRPEAATRDAPVFQLRARIGDEEVMISRNPEEELEPEVVRARAFLEKISRGLAEVRDPIGSLERFLGSRVPVIRGQAVQALLTVSRLPGLTGEDRRRARKILRDHLCVEEDPRIATRLKSALRGR